MQNFSARVCLVINPGLTILDNLKLGRYFWIIFWVLWQILFPKSCVCKFIMACLDYILFEFEGIFVAVYVLSLDVPSVPSDVFLKEPSV